jgi:FecR protein
MVTKVENQAQVGAAAAAVGTIVHMNDELKTGPKARLQVTFRDQTTLTLGENARIVVDKYVFNPEESAGELLLSSTKGAFRMATGRLAAMRDRQINVSTPNASLGVRGTDWWWGPMKGKLGVVMVSNSKVVVKKGKGEECGCRRHTDEKSCREETQNYCVWNRKKSSCDCCEVELTRAHEGTYVEPGKCPEDVRTWSEAEVQSALSTTQFGLAAAPSAIPTVVGAIVGVGVVVNQITKNNQLSP